MKTDNLPRPSSLKKLTPDPKEQPENLPEGGPEGAFARIEAATLAILGKHAKPTAG
jgi:hypothetical protein